ncbi:phosphatase PAP2 family protein [Kushneria phosphatilytica]|uniref:undecaprenyl-diphosphate phosphatase n=1 Tax=Kushneria phosphatilytica TaxID=657387 RepID=A0A1S1NTM3_9GAMM|nr:phosphatase PAP2 family protein [Kushneria phosphatilytica]OHV08955.1 hypothetical protein BH688_13325 [Kushneria phosphatilytica]QEL09719.1 phosphatase PAP2 family protein [Kushneria phosphatilytica]
MSSITHIKHTVKRPADSRDLRTGSVALALVILTTFVTVALPLLPVERDAMLFINQFAHRSVLVDHFFGVLSGYSFFSGAPLLALVCWAWFDNEEFAERTRILTGIVAAFGSAALTRLMQMFMPQHPRPIHTEGLDFTLPYTVHADTLQGWSSFPSDHAAVYAGLGLVLWRTLPRLPATFAVLLAALLCFTRIYLGYHFITDIIGGAALGMLTVCIASWQGFQQIGGWIAQFSRTRPGAFYALAFMMAYGIATLFIGLRSVISGLFAHL